MLDIFDEKVQRKPFNVPRYTGDPTDRDSVLQWYVDLYKEEFRKNNEIESRQCQVYITSATDEHIVRDTCSIVFTQVVSSRLMVSGLI